MMKQSDYALSIFSSGYNCAQAVAGAFADRFDIDEKFLLKSAACFGGGMGRMQLTCGAVTGALMVLGVKYGRSDDDEDISMKETAYAKAREFAEEFEMRAGSLSCIQLLGGVKTSTPEGKEKFIADKLHEKVCAPAVITAIEILEEMLEEKPE